MASMFPFIMKVLYIKLKAFTTLYKWFVLYFASAASNLLLLGGEDTLRRNKATIVSNNGSSCSATPQLPIAVSQTTSFLRGTPIYCGGRKVDWSFTSDCYHLDNKQWKKFASLGTRRQAAAGIVLESGSLWITGGYNAGKHLTSTEYIRPNRQVVYGNDLEDKVYGHCILKSLEDEYLVYFIGGENEYRFMSSTRKYFVTEQFSHYIGDAPSLNVARRRHGCTYFRSLNHDGRNVMLVAGGDHREGYATTTVEIWDYQTQGATWTFSKLR